MSNKHSGNGHPIRHNADDQAGGISKAYDSTVERAQHAYETSRDTARDAARQTAQGIEANPLGVLVGGLAFGAVAAALIPRSQREKDLLAPVGKRLSAAAVAATTAARETGRSELAGLGLSRDTAKERAQGLVSGLGRALSHAGEAAVQAAREKGTASQA